MQIQRRFFLKKLTKTVALLLTLTISFSLVGCGTKKSENQTDLVLPGGITWDSTAEEIIAAYGEPEPDGYYAESFEYTVYEYVTDDYNCHLEMKVYDDGGIGEIRYSLVGI